MDEDVRLTEREFEVIYMLSNGLQGQDLAARLGVSPATVSCYIRDIKKKTKTTSIVQAYKVLLNSRYHGLLKC